jgi:hypothetical protein
LELAIRTTRPQDRVCWWAEPGAHANGVGQSREASKAVPERCAEDVGVEGLLFIPSDTITVRDT